MIREKEDKYHFILASQPHGKEILILTNDRQTEDYQPWKQVLEVGFCLAVMDRNLESKDKRQITEIGEVVTGG